MKMHKAWRLIVPLLAAEVNSFSSRPSFSSFANLPTSSLAMSITSTDSWETLQSAASHTPVGRALDEESASRTSGTGAAFVQNKLRMFDANEKPKLTLYRDHGEYFLLSSCVESLSGFFHAYSLRVCECFSNALVLYSPSQHRYVSWMVSILPKDDVIDRGKTHPYQH
jgi:hypothetical protein